MDYRSRLTSCADPQEATAEYSMPQAYFVYPPPSYRRGSRGVLRMADSVMANAVVPCRISVHELIYRSIQRGREGGDDEYTGHPSSFTRYKVFAYCQVAQKNSTIDPIETSNSRFSQHDALNRNLLLGRMGLCLAHCCKAFLQLSDGHCWFCRSTLPPERLLTYTIVR
jgi:hypothetical protein